jgi:hypothetical protein
MLAVVLSACGGPTIDFWQADTSTVDFASNCSDEMTFRSSIKPVEVGMNSYLIYRIEKDGKTATVLDCDTLDASTCKNHDPLITFTVAGKELFRTDTNKSMIMGSTCNLLDTTNWTLTDMDKTLSMEQAHVLSLVDDATACAMVDTNYKAASPNMMGLDGCQVTYHLTFKKK